MMAVTAEVMQVELPSEGAIEVYMAHLEQLTDEQLTQAFNRAPRELETYGKFPALNKLLNLAGVVTGEMAEEVEAASAWDAAVHFSLKYVGNWPDSGQVRINPERLAELPAGVRDTVRRLGGWRVLTTMDETNVPFVRKDFIEHYKLVRHEQRNPSLGVQLTGEVGEKFKQLVSGTQLKSLGDGR